MYVVHLQNIAGLDKELKQENYFLENRKNSTFAQDSLHSSSCKVHCSVKERLMHSCRVCHNCLPILSNCEHDSEWRVRAGARVIHEQWKSVSVLTGRAGVWLIPTSSGQLLWSSSLYVFPTIHWLSCWVGNLQKEECESTQLVVVSLRQRHREFWFPHNLSFTTWVSGGSQQGTTRKAVKV